MFDDAAIKNLLKPMNVCSDTAAFLSEHRCCATHSKPCLSNYHMRTNVETHISRTCTVTGTAQHSTPDLRCQWLQRSALYLGGNPIKYRAPSASAGSAHVRAWTPLHQAPHSQLQKPRKSDPHSSPFLADSFTGNVSNSQAWAAQLTRFASFSSQE